MRSLAILGGTPAFATPMHVGRPNIGDPDEFIGYVRDILANRWLSNAGPFVRQLERELEAHLGVKHCVAVCNATIGLQIAAAVLGMRGEVVLPSFTFVAGPHALLWGGVTPVFGDIDPATHNLDPRAVEALIGPRTTGILATHLWGRPGTVLELEALARARGLKLLFDAAHAFGCTYQGRGIATYGDAAVFSFHATKVFNSFEGGAIATNDDHLAARLRLSKRFGFADVDVVEGLGTNGKMNEAAAAMGLTNLRCVDRFIAVNRHNYRLYREALGAVPGLSVLEYDDEHERCSYQYVVVEVDPDQCGLRRDELLRVLVAENILARRYFWPGCHRMEPYCHLYPEASRRLPQTERVAERVLVLPTGTAMAEGDVAVVCEVMRTAVAQADRVRQAVGF